MKTIFDGVSFEVTKCENESFMLESRQYLYDDVKTWCFTTVDDLFVFLAAQKIDFKASKL